MSTTVRAKFTVTSLIPYYGGTGVGLSAVYSADPNHENKAFSDATPSGRIDIVIAPGKPALEAFEMGKQFYVDFTRADVAPGCEKFGDAAIEAAVVAKGKSVSRITLAQIDALMARVDFKVAERRADDTSTFVHAYLDGRFFLATGHSACVDPAGFDADIGLKIAMGKAETAARDKLWELEGYRLFQQLQAA